MLDAKKHPAWGGQAYITLRCVPELPCLCCCCTQPKRRRRRRRITTQHNEMRKEEGSFFSSSSSFLARQVNKKVRETAILLSLRQANRGFSLSLQAFVTFFFFWNIFSFLVYLVFQPSSSSVFFHHPLEMPSRHLTMMAPQPPSWIFFFFLKNF